MKAIVYSRPDGGLSVFNPAEGARLAHRITLADGTVLQHLVDDKPRAVSADTFRRIWPVEGATVDWAETEDAFMQRILPKVVPPGATNVQIVEAAAVPADRTFRNAWVPGHGRVEHDMPKARAIHMDAIRAARAERITALDVAFTRAQGKKDQTEADAVEAKRQALRDLPQTFDLTKADTPEKLKATWPEELK